MRLVWPVMVTVATALIAYPGLQAFVQGASVGEWIVDIVLGLLLLILYVGIKLGARLEEDRTSSGQSGPTERILVTVFALWFAVGAVFLVTVRSSFDVIGFTITGAIGGVVMLALLYRS
ncbi:hypothetical protein C497_18167 [Halalkalicoccus jeotgali B3]|uniref:Uncharacterized protein n=1 Tax=Halalkalicoccus jeotgali (strain DSM 18796 / CECT 7217 / JCM 14584 / KCTC 4019 / B3) TaxID=795797 RepID=D8J545_HALJB|nr:hypothetical protein HacjB3_01165 [Halalkalicoccus jeotgali B3]ELY33352.1 hypothetical protein C497_18167 [Halalkalicoccus jeotgali B3]